jgi:hypothetical protein
MIHYIHRLYKVEITHGLVPHSLWETLSQYVYIYKGDNLSIESLNNGGLRGPSWS